MKKFISVALVMSLGLAVVACGGGTEEVVETEAPQAVMTEAVETEAALAPIIAETEAAQVNTEAASIPLNEDAYTEFDEPVMYEVLEDCNAWSDNSLQTYSGTLLTGSIVNGVATDGYYLILDDQQVVEISHLQIFE